MCVFNKTHFTNATIMSDTLLMCDSPAFFSPQGYTLFNADKQNMYQLQVTIDGGKQIVGTPQDFNYYKQVTVEEVEPRGGPVEGNTEVVLNVTGLSASCLCDIRVRFDTYEVKPTILKETGQLSVIAPAASLPGGTVVQVTYNGQQYQKERVVHVKDPKATYYYYDQPLVTFHEPMLGPSIGGTRMKLDGHGLAPLAAVHNRLFARFIDPVTKAELAPATEIKKEELTNSEALWYTPKLASGTKALLQISPNRKDWVDVKAPKSDYSFAYYESPHITQIDPTFGPVKDDNVKMTIDGTGFICPDEGVCKNLRVRFGEPPFAIYVHGNLTGGQVVCWVPKYTKPDILRVELTLNGLDYTHDKKNYGFYDPYVIDVQPRLIHIDGSTDVTLKGIGFVDSGELKVMFANSTSEIECSGAPCIQRNAKFVDKNHIKAGTFPQADVVHKSGKASVMWEPVEVEASVYAGIFTHNKITLRYYEEPKYAFHNVDKEAPANVPHHLIIKADIEPRDMEHIKKHS